MIKKRKKQNKQEHIALYFGIHSSENYKNYTLKEGSKITLEPFLAFSIAMLP